MLTSRLLLWLAYGRDVLGLKRIVAITSPDNQRQAGCLKSWGCDLNEWFGLSEGAEEVRLFGADV
jgi:RimJ/RimL family protein N-acetyltransferase